MSFNEALLDQKKAKFNTAVVNICRKHQIEPPIINFDGCSEESSDHLAHMHPDSRTICVSERQLTVLNFDDIESTAAHETAHLFEEDHGSAFADRNIANKIAGFRPGPGVTFVTNSKNIHNKPTRISKPEPPDPTKCYTCFSKKKIMRCKHCKEFFCSKHFAPVEPYVGNPGDKKPVIDEPETYHACAPYYDFVQKRELKKEKRYAAALDRLLRRKNTSLYDDNSEEEFVPQESEVDSYPELPPTKRRGSYVSLEKQAKYNKRRIIMISTSLAVIMLLSLATYLILKAF